MFVPVDKLIGFLQKLQLHDERDSGSEMDDEHDSSGDSAPEDDGDGDSEDDGEDSEEGIDVTPLMTSLCALRGQSLEELLGDLGRFSGEEEEAPEDRPPMRWVDAARQLGALESADEVIDHGVSVWARIEAQAGMVLHAFSCEPLEGMSGALMFLGVHCFPGEPMDPTRKRAQILLDVQGGAYVLEAELYLDAFDERTPEKQIYLLNACKVRVAVARGVGEA